MTKAHQIDTLTVTDHVRDHLRDRIITGDLKPGDRIIQNTIAEDLGVSRIPVRESIHALIAEGLLVAEPHHGAVVTEVSVEQAEEVFGIRALLEPKLLQLAVPRLTKDGLKAARKSLRDMKKYRKKRSDFTTWAASHWSFHQSLYAYAQQPLTLDIVQGLVRHSERYIALEIADQASSEEDQRDHEEILRLCSEGDAEAAADILRYHILKTPEVVDTQ